MSADEPLRRVAPLGEADGVTLTGRQCALIRRGLPVLRQSLKCWHEVNGRSMPSEVSAVLDALDRAAARASANGPVAPRVSDSLSDSPAVLEDPPPSRLTTTQVARLAECDSGQVRRAVRKGRLPSYTRERGKGFEFAPDDVERWIASRCTTVRARR